MMEVSSLNPSLLASISKIKASSWFTAVTLWLYMTALMIEIGIKSCFLLPAPCLTVSESRIACLGEVSAHQHITGGQKAEGKGRITVV